MRNWCSISCGGNFQAAPQPQLSSPGLTGRPSIPEAPAIESRSRGVLDTPLEPVIGLAEGETRWRGMTDNFGEASCAFLRPCGLLAIGEMHGAGAARRMGYQFGGCDIVGGHARCRRLRRHRLLHAAILRRLILRRDVVQHLRQPALGFNYVPAFARSVIFHLVALDLADAEIETR